MFIREDWVYLSYFANKEKGVRGRHRVLSVRPAAKPCRWALVAESTHLKIEPPAWEALYFYADTVFRVGDLRSLKRVPPIIAY